MGNYNHLNNLKARVRLVESMLEEVFLERSRQDARWGEQNHPDGTGSADVLVDWEDLANEAKWQNDQAVKDGTLTFRGILKEEVYEAFAEDDPEKLYEELNQVAAVAVAWKEKLVREGKVELG
jgi:hypothetical protein